MHHYDDRDKGEDYMRAIIIGDPNYEGSCDMGEI